VDSLIPVVQGQIQLVQSGAVGAGTDPAYTVPVNTRMRIIACSAELVASAAVASRIASLQISRGGVIAGQVTTQLAQLATLTRRYGWASGCASPIPTPPSAEALGLPFLLYLEASDVISLQTTNLQAGDQWTPISLLVESWVTA